MIEIKQLDTEGRWWKVGRWEVDLNADEYTYPPNVRACALAHRDADDDEGWNVAALLASQIEAEDYEPLPVVSEWLFNQSQKIVKRLRERIARIEGRADDDAA